jgi:hypothetical protein
MELTALGSGMCDEYEKDYSLFCDKTVIFIDAIAELKIL